MRLPSLLVFNYGDPVGSDLDGAREDWGHRTVRVGASTCATLLKRRSGEAISVSTKTLHLFLCWRAEPESRCSGGRPSPIRGRNPVVHLATSEGRLQSPTLEVARELASCVAELSTASSAGRRHAGGTRSHAQLQPLPKPRNLTQRASRRPKTLSQNHPSHASNAAALPWAPGPIFEGVGEWVDRGRLLVGVGVVVEVASAPQQRKGGFDACRAPSPSRRKLVERTPSTASLNGCTSCLKSGAPDFIACPLVRSCGRC